ncbi:MAG: transglycosylase SLT domain-containing protein [Mariprofundaceae bacterium]
MQIKSTAGSRIFLTAVMAWLFLTLAPLPSSSSPNSSRITPHQKPIEQQRDWFIQAKKAIAKDKIGEFTRLREKLEDYPLVPYLDIWLIRKNLSDTDARKIENTLMQYADIPESHDLRLAWIRHLADEKRWTAAWREFEKLKSGKGLLIDFQLQALWKLNRKDEAAKLLGEQWIRGKKIRPEESAGFAYWRKLGHPSDTDIWQRISNQMRRGKTGGARRSAVYLNKHDKIWFERWLEMRKHPEKVLRSWKWSTTGKPAEDILIDGLRRLGRKDVRLSWSLLKKNKSRLHDKAYNRLQRYLALHAARRHLPEARKWLADIQTGYRNKEVWQWQTRMYLIHNEWRPALATIRAMPAALRDSSRWSYWKARSLSQLGKKKPAEALFAKLAKERGFYSFLSAERLGLPFVFAARDYEVSQQEIHNLSLRPGIRRAFEWLQLLELNKASREWHASLSPATENEWRAAARLAHHWKWHNQAIIAAYKGMMPDFLLLRFPLQYEKHVLTAAKRTGLPPSWILAIIRQESAFNAHARSRSGALGLMQLMPPTGREVARQQKIKLRSKNQLLDPKLNIRLGSTYLATMLNRFEGRLSLAAAAYNAGPRRVNEWLQKNAGKIDAEAWIEAIPFSETRRYVQQVLAFSIVYDWKLKTPEERKLASLL